MSVIRDFWDEQARIHGVESHATAPDHHYRELEIAAILRNLSDEGAVLDVGCGNGYSTFKFAKACPNAVFIGLDFSPEMIKAAQKQRKLYDIGTANVNFITGDVRNYCVENFYDTIITERCLINILSWQEQQTAIINLRNSLKSGGKLILVENTIDGLIAINHLRVAAGLPEIRTRWHNLYFDRMDLNIFLNQIGFRVIAEQNIGSLYYIISRVVNAKLAQMEGMEPDYDSPINEIASKLPILAHYHYSPNVMWILRKER